MKDLLRHLTEEETISLQSSKEQLLTVLANEGEGSIDIFKSGVSAHRPYDIVRYHLLKAGYTDFANGNYFFQKRDYLAFIIDQPELHGHPKGWHRLRVLADIVKNVNPDTFPHRDPVNDHIMQQLRKAPQVADELRQARRSWYYLGSWFARPNEEGIYETYHWLNPQDQYYYQSGWYTLNELEQWKDNQGPIIKIKPPVWLDDVRKR